MASSKRCLSLPAAARRSVKKSTKQAVLSGSQPQDAADRHMLAQLMAAAPGVEIGLDDDEPIEQLARRHDELHPAAADMPADADGLHQQVAPPSPANTDSFATMSAMPTVTAAGSVYPGPAAAAAAQDAAMAIEQPSASIITTSVQTLANRPPSPSVAVGCKRPRRTCSNKAKQLLQEFQAGGCEDEEHDTKPPPARKRSKKADDDDKDFEAGGISSSEDEELDDVDEHDNDDFGVSDSEEVKKPKKGQKKGAGAKGPKAAAGRPRASTGSVAHPAARNATAASNGRGSAQASHHTSLASAPRGCSGISKKTSIGRAKSATAAAAPPLLPAAAADQTGPAGVNCLSGVGQGADGSAAAGANNTAAVSVATAGAQSGSSHALSGDRKSGQTKRRSGVAATATIEGAAAAAAAGPDDTVPSTDGQPRAPMAQPATVQPGAAVVLPQQCRNTPAASAVSGTAGVHSGGQQPAASAASYVQRSASCSRPFKMPMGSPAGAQPAVSSASSGSLGYSLDKSNAALGISRDKTAAAAGSHAMNRVGSEATGVLLGGAAFRVPGLRRPGAKRVVTPQK